MGDDLDELGVRVTGTLDGGDIRLAHAASFARKFRCETNGRVRLHVVRRAAPVCGDLRIVELRHLAGEIRVRRQAIVATIHFSHRQRDALPRRCVQGAFCERAGEAEIGFQRRRAVSEDPQQVRDGAELFSADASNGCAALGACSVAGIGMRDMGFHSWSNWP